MSCQAVRTNLIWKLVQLIRCLMIASVIVIANIQLYSIITEYLKYEVINEIETGRSGKMTLPDISLCSPVNRFINFTLLEAIAPSFTAQLRRLGNITNQDDFLIWTTSNNFGRDYFRAKIGHLTVQQIIEASYSPTSLITELQLSYHNSFLYLSAPATFHLCELSSIIKGFSTCIAIQCSRSTPYVLLTEDIIKTSGTFARIYLDPEIAINLESIDIYLTSPNTYPRGSSIPFITVQTQPPGREFTVDFSEQRTILLPPPYSTNCKDYSKEGYESQSHRMESCLNAESVARTSTYFRNTIERSYLTRPLAFSYWDDIYKNTTKQTIYREIVAICAKMAFMPDCQVIMYSPVLKRDLDYRAGHFRIQFILPTGSFLINMCKAKSNFTQLILFIGSVLGTWFGFNVAGFLNDLAGLVKKIETAKLFPTIIKPNQPHQTDRHKLFRQTKIAVK